METIDTFLMAMMITAIGLCVGFIILLVKHKKEHKHERTN